MTRELRQNRGFTLLEVMVAMAILALGLTIVLSSQAGLFAATRRVQSETVAASLMRCKMSEVELDLLQNGFQLLDQNDSGECCEDEDDSTFSCRWKVETVELPQPSSFEADAAEEGEDASAFGAAASPLGPMGALLGGTADTAGSLGDLAGSLGDAGGGGGLIGMALSMVYPDLKPMLEASIRKVTVTVVWREGEKERSFDAIQYVTNPLEGNLSPNAAEGMEDILKQVNGAMGSGTTDGAEGEE